MRRRTGSPMKQSSLIPVERIERAIYLIRGEKVMLDRDVLLVCCRGISPTVREGSVVVWEPSLTVGLAPRS